MISTFYFRAWLALGTLLLVGSGLGWGQTLNVPTYSAASVCSNSATAANNQVAVGIAGSGYAANTVINLQLELRNNGNTATTATSATFQLTTNGSGALSGNYTWTLPNNLANLNNRRIRVLSVAPSATATSGIGGQIDVHVVPTITTQPATLIVCPTPTALMPVSAAGGGTLTYQWRLGTTNLSNVAGLGGLTGTSTTTLGFSTPIPVSRSATNYNVSVSNTCGTVISDNAELFVLNTSYTLSASASAYCAGSTGVTLTLSGSQNTVTYELLKNGASLSPAQTLSGTGAALQFANVTAGTGTYSVRATKSSASCTMGSTSVTENPQPTATPASLTACSTEPGGSTASFDLTSLTATVLNGQPNTSVSFFNDANLTDAVATPAAHVSATGTVYAQVTNTTTNCKSTGAAIALTVVPAPNAGTAGAALSRCINATEAIALADQLTGEDTGGTWSLTTAPGGSTYSHGNGSTFTPSATGVVAGTYTFTYTVSGTAPCPNATAQVTVNVHALPTAPTAPAPQTFCTNTLPHTFNFSVAPGSGADAIEWATNPDFSGATQVVGNPGTFTIGVNSSVTVYVRSKNTTTGCVSAGVSTTATVLSRPTAAVSGGGTVCVGEPLPSVLFTFSGAVPFSLTYTDGTSSTTVPAINGASYQLPNAPAGTYTVTALSDANCTAEAADLTGSATVTVIPTPTAYNVGGGGTFCAPSATVTLSGSQTGYGYQLQNASSQNVGSAQTGTGSALTFTVTESGTYHVVATSNTTPACTAPMNGTAEITLNSAQGTATLSGTTTVCAGGSADLAVNVSGASGTYTVVYNPGTVTVANYTSGSAIPVSPTATTTYSLVSVTAANGCPVASLEGTAAVTVRPLPAATIGTTTPAVCQSGQGTLTFTGQENTTVAYTITDVNGTSSASVSFNTGESSKNVTVFPNFTTTYAITSVAYTDAPACANPITGQSVTVELRDPPTATLTGTATVCEGGSTTLTLTATPNTTVVYTKGGVNQDPVAVGVSGTATIPTGALTANTAFALFTVAYQNAPTCQQVINNQTVIVTVRPLPTASIAGGTAVCAGETATLTITGTPGARVHFTATGTFADGTSRVLNNEGTATISGSFSENTTFTLTSVEYTDEPACPVALTGQSATATVTVNPNPTATVSGGGTVCAGETLPNVSVALTGTAPWSIIYTNGSGSTTVSTITGSPYVIANAAAGTYSVTSVSDAHCAGTASGSATVTVNPKPLFSLSATSNSVTTSASNASGPASLPLSICAGQLFSFAPVTTTPGSGVGVIVQITAVTGAPTYEGSPETTDPQPIDLGTTGSFFNNTSYGPHGGSGTITQVYTPYFDANTSGTYDAGDCLGDPITLNYSIHALPTPTLGGDGEVCVGSTIPLTSGVAGGTWSSSNPDVATIDASSGVVTGVAPGTVILTYTVTIDGCTGSSTKSVTVKSQPTLGGVSALATTVCDGESVTFTASGLPPNASALVAYTLTGATTASGTVTLATDASGNASYSPQVLAVGQTTLEITAVTVDGCTANFTGKTVTATVNPPTGTPVFTNPTLTLCQDAPNTPYVATAANATSIGYSLTPAEAGTISTETGLVDWSADFAGTATVTATATGLCGTTTASVQVLINPKPAPVVQADDATPCFGTSAILSLTLGYSSYSWKKIGNPTVEVGTGASYSASESGDYAVTVTNASGCTATSEPIAITVGEQLVFGPPAITNVTCHGESTGSLAVSATGGSGTLTYTLTPGGTSNTTGAFAGLAAGTYSVTVTDANNPVCQLTLSNLEITQPAAALGASSVQNAPILCHGGTTTVTVSGTGGTAPYQGTGTFVVGAGTYNYTVTDANGCTAMTSVTVGEPNQLQASSSVTAPILCHGGTATVTVSATGGTGSYTGTGTFAVGAGTYNYTVTDANGCTATTSVTVTEPLLLQASGAVGPAIACHGGTTTVTVSATGGTGSYTGTGTFTVGAGPYSFTVTDANGCTSTVSGTLSQPTAVTASITAPVAEACVEGSLTLTGSGAGGRGALGFAWSTSGAGSVSPAATSGSTFTFSGATAGTVTVLLTVTDENNCPATASQVVTIHAKPATPAGTVSLPGSEPEAIANDGSYSICDETAGSANLAFTNSLADHDVLEVSTDAGFTNLLPLSIYPAGSLPSGTWYLRVRNALTGCLSEVVKITIDVKPKPVVVLNEEAGNTNHLTTCDGASSGAIDIAVSGGAGPFTFAWTKDGDPGFSASTEDLTGLGTGDYTVTVTGSGCPATATFSVVALPAVTFSVSASDIACHGETNGSIEVTASGGSGSYLFSNDGGTTFTTVPQSGPYAFTGLAAGTYSILVKDGGPTACVSEPQSVTLTEPAALLANASLSETSGTANDDGTICNGASVTLTAAPSGGTPNYAVAWFVGTSEVGTGLTLTVSPSATTTYRAVVTDANGCVFSEEKTITVNPRPTATITSLPVTLCPGETTTTVEGTVTAVGAWTLTLSNGQTTTGTGNGSFSFTVNPPNGVTTYTLTGLTDANACAAQAGDRTGSVTITKEDVTPPTVSNCPVPAASYPTDAGGCSTTLSFTAPTVSDNCPGDVAVTWAATGATTASGTGSITNLAFAKGTTTVTFTVTDANGNANTSCSFNVVVNDTQNPTLTAPTAVSVNADAGVCYATNVALGAPTFGDNCPGATVVASVADVEVTASTQFPVGQTTVTWTVTDASGNTATATQIVTVTDNQDPTITAPAPVTVSTDPNACEATNVALGTPTTADNCAVQSVSSNAPTSFPKGNTTVTYTVTDVNGRTATATQTVTVNDTQNPSFTAQATDQNVTLGNDCNITVPDLVALTTATDNCPGVTVAQSPAAGTLVSSSHDATTPVTITATDAGGLTTSYTVTLTAKDLTPPTFTTQATDQNASLDADCKLTIPNLVAATVAADNCAGVTVTQAPTAGTVVASGHNQTTPVIITATDAAGLTAQYTVTLTGKDVTPPTAPTLANATGQCAVTLTAPTAPDNCGGTITGTTTDSTVYTTQGTRTVTWTFTDPAGNVSTAPQTVVVKDTDAPVINVANGTFTAQLGNACTVEIDLGTPTVNDNCTGYTVTNDAPGFVSGTTYAFPVGTTTVTYTVRDIGGNTATTTQTVTVSDVAPVINQDLASSLTACENSSIGFGITLTSHTGPTAHYQWYKNGSPVSGQTNATLAFASVTTADAGTYKVRVWGCTEAAFTESAALTLAVDQTSLAGTIAPVPSVCEGSTATLTLTGHRGTVQWQQLVGSTWTDMGTNSATLTTAALTTSTQFRAVVTNGVCSPATSDPYTVGVDQPSNGGTVAISGGQPTTLCNVTNASVSGPQTTTVTVTGIVGSIVRWESATSLAGPWTTIASTSATLPVSNLTATTYYRAVVKNGNCPEAASAAPVAVVVSQPALITSPPANASVCPGTVVSFFVFTTPSTGVGYSWQSRPGAAAPFATVGGATSSFYQIPGASVTTALGGSQYRILVTNGACVTTSNAATLNVNQPPAVGTQPVSLTRCPGGQAQFTATATGAGLTYRWQKWNGSSYADVSNAAGKIVGATTATLTVSNLAAADAGQYRLRVQGSCGSAFSDPAALTVIPTISFTNPVNRTVGVGGTTTFSTTASGGTLSYRWQKNGVNLANGGTVSGATTATLTITGATALDQGSYRVVITNECGSVTSAAATLTVTGSSRLATPAVQPLTPTAAQPIRTALSAKSLASRMPGYLPVPTPAAEPKAGALGGADYARRSAEVEAEAAVFPNPGDGSSFRVGVPDAGRTRLTLFTTEGRNLPIATRALGASVMEVTPTQRLDSGLYLLYVETNGTRQTRKVLVAR